MNDRSERIYDLRLQLSSLQWDMDDLSGQIEALEDELDEVEHECPNCGEYSAVVGLPCSRPCTFQLEWAAELKARDAAA